jgi:hypothetical protein
LVACASGGGEVSPRVRAGRFCAQLPAGGGGAATRLVAAAPCVQHLSIADEACVRDVGNTWRGREFLGCRSRTLLERAQWAKGPVISWHRGSAQLHRHHRKQIDMLWVRAHRRVPCNPKSTVQKHVCARTGVWSSQTRARRREAAHKGEIKPSSFYEPSRQSVVAAWPLQGATCIRAFSQAWQLPVACPSRDNAPPWQHGPCMHSRSCDSGWAAACGLS